MKVKKQKIGILSLGCPRNLVDSEGILGRLNLKGYSIVDMEKSNIAIINTCSFIEDAKKESIEAILDLIQLKKEGKLKKIIVYGCLPQRYKLVLTKELPEIDAFIGRVSLNHKFQRFPLTPRHYCYLKICEGCINNCSYCCIPKIKGKFSSLSLDSILKKVNLFDKQNIRELNIVGQDITGYGIDLYKEPKLSLCLNRILSSAKNIGWIRLLYLHPSRVNEELLALIKHESKICKYIDLPLQHINDRILKLMNRKTRKKEIIKLVERIRKKIPEAAIRTSIIVGFPTETDKEFKELKNFIEETRFERLGVFIYSREEGTPAYNLKELPKRVKSERFNTLMSCQQKISGEQNSFFLGKTLDALVEEKRNDSYLGRSQFDAPEVDGLIFIRSNKKLNVGDFVKVKITDTLEYDLVGEVI